MALGPGLVLAMVAAARVLSASPSRRLLSFADRLIRCADGSACDGNESEPSTRNQNRRTQNPEPGTEIDSIGPGWSSRWWPPLAFCLLRCHGVFYRLRPADPVRRRQASAPARTARESRTQNPEPETGTRIGTGTWNPERGTRNLPAPFPPLRTFTLSSRSEIAHS